MKLLEDNGQQRWAKHGRGKIEYLDGRIYDGEWHENKMHGNGLMVYPSGDSYEGEFVDDKANGFGKYYNSTRGDRFEGYFLNDNPHG